MLFESHWLHLSCVNVKLICRQCSDNVHLLTGMCACAACLPVSQFLLLLGARQPALPCAPVRLSHCAMRAPVPHTLTWGASIRSLRVPWSSLVPLVFIFSMLAPPGGAVAEVTSQGAGVLLVKISSVLNPEGRDAAGACCAAAGKVRWDILGHSCIPIFLTT